MSVYGMPQLQEEVHVVEFLPSDDIRCEGWVEHPDECLLMLHFHTQDDTHFAAKLPAPLEGSMEVPTLVIFKMCEEARTIEFHSEIPCTEVHVIKALNLVVWGPLNMTFPPGLITIFYDVVCPLGIIVEEDDEAAADMDFEETGLGGSGPSSSTSSSVANKERGGIRWEPAEVQVHVFSASAPSNYHFSQEGEFRVADIVGFHPEEWKKLRLNGEKMGARYDHTVCYVPHRGFLVTGGICDGQISADILLIRQEMRTSVVGHLKRPRRGHRCVTFGDQVVIVAGGHRYNTSLDMYYDDVILVDFAGKKVEEIQVPSYSPPARRDHTCNLLGHHVILFGGEDKYNRKNDVHAFDMETGSWSVVFCAGDAPDARSFHVAATLSPNHLLIGGGLASEKILKKDYWIFHYHAETHRAIWHRIVFVGEEVPKLMGHSACVFGNYVVIFGGHTSSKFCSDTYVLDFREYLRFHLDNDAVDLEVHVPCVRHSSIGHRMPQPRANHAACAMGDSMFVFGGRNESGFLEDVWMLDFKCICSQEAS